jgi:hypothetical protein
MNCLIRINNNNGVILMKLLILSAFAVLTFAGVLSASTHFQANNKEYHFLNNDKAISVSNVLDADSLYTIKQLKDSLTLTDSQVTVVDSILTDAQTKINNLTSTDQQKVDDTNQLITDAYDAIKTVLSDDQSTKFEDMISGK